MSASSLLRHLHLARITPFARATAIQDTFVRQHLDYKALNTAPFFDSPPPPSPIPTILTFSPTPVYTTGRRELGKLSAATVALLREPLPEILGTGGLDNGYANGFSPDVEETLRGGQITLHGPGQLVIYPILDLKAVKSAKWPKGLTAKCYVNVLEEATINTLKSFGIRGFRTENPGVWVSKDEKIAALGLHLRRNVTSFGVGLNVRTDLRYFDKIVACGLEGKKTTSIKQELKQEYGLSMANHIRHSKRVSMSPREVSMAKTLVTRAKMTNLSRSWVEEFKTLVWGDQVNLQSAKVSGESSEEVFLRLLELDDAAQDCDHWTW
ncbi:putative octanoyltransferase [Hyphodiscus hymeniophilus]|uniref:lipoyl(octanoyl) transferase n=1 Tax=Hyphodiscus hymeniophilus TaxID=353542 RepID=A0A9P7AY87_9HELO|nr:putative octanoyltransferase [Hyphodiscus hymeniophilus]